MANIEARQITFTYGTTKNYFTSSGINLDYQGWNQQPMAIVGRREGTATMKDTGKAVLYPRAGVHPIKADLQVIGSASVNDAFIEIRIDDIIIFRDWFTADSNQYTKLLENLTDSAIIDSTINSTITFILTSSNSSLLTGLGLRNNSYMRFYYQQWDLTAQKVGDGWGTLLAPGRVYDGENVNYSYLVADGCTFHGWYSDANHINLVSSSYIYNVTATQDLILYPYVTKNTLALNNVYAKTDFQLGTNTPGWFKPERIWYKTLNGWEAQNDTNNFSTENNYRYSNHFINIINLTNTSNSYTFSYYPWSHGIIYIKNANNYILNNLQGSTNLSFKHMQDGIIIQHDGIYYTGSQTVTIQFKGPTDATSIAMTLTISFTTFNRDIQFEDLEGNRYKTTLVCTSPFTVTTPSGYTGFIGWKEKYCGIPTGRILQLNESYWDVGWNNEIIYEPVFSS